MNSTVGRLLFLVQVSRPILWPVLPLLYAFGLHAAHAKWTPIAIAQALLLTFPMSLIGCGLNDGCPHQLVCLDIPIAEVEAAVRATLAA